MDESFLLLWQSALRTGKAVHQGGRTAPIFCHLKDNINYVTTLASVSHKHIYVERESFAIFVHCSVDRCTGILSDLLPVTFLTASMAGFLAPSSRPQCIGGHFTFGILPGVYVFVPKAHFWMEVPLEYSLKTCRQWNLHREAVELGEFSLSS